MIWKFGKAVFFILVALLATACVQYIRNSGQDTLPTREDDRLRLATLNVHYIILSQPTGPWSVADWERRKGPMDAAFKAIAPDVMGFQEMESFQRGNDGGTNLTLDWLLAQNPDYAAGAVGDWRIFPSTQPILYRRAAFDLVDQGWFFFSDTPDVIYSRTFNGSFPAFASWVKLRDGRGREFRVVNVHFEFKSASNRMQSAQLVAARTAPWVAADETVFLIGDINARAGSAPIRVLEAAGFDFASIAGSTYHLNRGLNLFGAIDHIAVAGAATIPNAPVVLRQKFNGEWPTDHYPVVADVRLDATQ